MKINLKQLVRVIANYLVPTPATVRRHRAPSARFTTLEALAKTNGDTLTRDGRSYTLTTSDLRVLEFDNLAQVKAFFSDFRADGKQISPIYPGDADYVERPRNVYKIDANGNLTPGPAADIGCVEAKPAAAPPAVYERLFKVEQPTPFVPVSVTPIASAAVAPTTDINRD